MKQEDLKEVLYYDHESGKFIWLERPEKFFKSKHDCLVWNARYAKKEAGCLVGKNKNKVYLNIRVFGKRYAAHRLAWLYITGKMPTKNIDHIDGNSLNNSFSNLRDVSHSDNSKNMRFKKGEVGIYQDKRTGKFRSQIQSGGKYIYLGTFSKREDAILARKEALRKYKFSESHGSVKNA